MIAANSKGVVRRVGRAFLRSQGVPSAGVIAAKLDGVVRECLTNPAKRPGRGFGTRDHSSPAPCAPRTHFCVAAGRPRGAEPIKRLAGESKPVASLQFDKG